jgi:hypothetical protein
VTTIATITKDGNQFVGPNRFDHKDSSACIAGPSDTMEAQRFKGGCGRCQVS